MAFSNSAHAGGPQSLSELPLGDNESRHDGGLPAISPRGLDPLWNMADSGKVKKPKAKSGKSRKRNPFWTARVNDGGTTNLVSPWHHASHRRQTLSLTQSRPGFG